jgi:MFS family permease
MVLVNTIVLVRSDMGLGETQVAIALGAFGGGSMLAALLLPRLLSNRPDRPVMISGAALLIATLLALSFMSLIYETQWLPLLVGWFVIGIGYSVVLTPSGRLLKRSAHTEDRPAVYAAQFALSHACWLVTYPLAGWLMTFAGSVTTFGVLAVVAAAGMFGGVVLWPRGGEIELEHTHANLPGDHPHMRDGQPHRHAIVIDDFHEHWPRVDEG